MMKLYIFDLDGTLADTIHDIGNCMNLALASEGFTPHTIEEYFYFVGDGRTQLLQRACPKDVSEAAFYRVAERYDELYAEKYLELSRPYDGMPEALLHLYRDGAVLAVLSNKPHAITTLMVEKLFTIPYGLEFAKVLGHRKGFPLKPDPSGIFEIMAAVGAKPGDTEYFGDTSIDMRTGVAAGLAPTGVLWGFRKEKELVESGAARIIRSPAEIV